MRIEFEVKVSDSAKERGPMINTAIFKTPKGEELVIDRCSTEWWTNEDGAFMLWRQCYIWDGLNENFLEENDSRIKDVEFQYFEIEDEAPIDYEVEVVNVYF